MIEPNNPETKIDGWAAMLDVYGLPMKRANNAKTADPQTLDFLASLATQTSKSAQYPITQQVRHSLICQRCGERFLSPCATAKYCSQRCRQRKPKAEVKPCLQCGQPYQPLRNTGKYHPECRDLAYRKKVGTAGRNVMEQTKDL